MKGWNMDRILHELYHGMIRPEEEYRPAQEVRQERRKLDTHQQALLERIQKIAPDIAAEMSRLFEAENSADAMEMEQAYIQGMRMGARLTIALLREKEK